jgi:hypothetical protein
MHTSDVEWSAASINMPLEPGDRIYTGRDGRVEIEFDEGSVLRLAENTDVEILSLREKLIQLHVLIGLSTLTVAGNVDFEVNTPGAAFNTICRGVYRFDVVENGDTDAIVRKGELEAASNQFTRRVFSGELLHVQVGGSPAISRYSGRDSWDEWNDRRDADRQAYASRNHLPATVYIGISDLDRYGRWMHVESYGMAWVPISIGAGWSPYSIGRWCYRPFHGWTWISYEPWGWLPYHYGRWYHSISFGWCWLPGPSFSFNFWSPGLVTFYHGPGWISWCPLGPGDYYNVHHYHFNRRIHGYQLARMRALHTRAPGNCMNQRVRGAFRTAHIDQFRNGSFRDRDRDGRWGNIEQPWRQGVLVRDRLDIQPTSASYHALPGSTAVHPAATRKTRPAVVRTAPTIDAGNRERFVRITNPEAASLHSRITEGRGQSTAMDRRSGQSSRTIQVRQEARTPSGNMRQALERSGASEPALSERSRSQTGTLNRRSEGNTRVIQFRPAETTRPETGSGLGNNRATPEMRRMTAPTANPEVRSPSGRQNPPRQRYQSRNPEQVQAQRPATQNMPRTEYRGQPGTLEFRSTYRVRPDRGNTGVAGSSINRNTGRTSSAPTQSNSSSQRSGGVHSMRTPSGTGTGSSAVRSSSGRSRSGFSAPAGRRDSGASKATKGHSSGGGRNRR